MNRAIYSAAAEQGRVGGIYNGIDFQRRDIAGHNFKSRGGTHRS